jgi:PAS domain S-box-containing protein
MEKHENTSKNKESLDADPSCSRASQGYFEKLEQALYEISEKTHSLSNEDELYRSLHEIVGRFINGRNFFIALRQERDGRQYIKFVYYFDEFDAYMQGLEFEVDPEVKHSMTGYLLKSGKPLLLVPEIFDEFCRENNISPLGTKAHSLVGAPFYLEHLSGVVLVQSYYDYVYTDKDKDLMAYVARHIGDALQRKKTIDDIREANDIFSLFLRYSPAHVYIKEITNGESIIVKVSDNYAASLNKSSEELIGKNMADLFPPDFAVQTTNDDLEVIRNGVLLQTEDVIDGRTYSTIKFPIVQGGKSLLAGYSIDITERKQMEDALRESEKRYKVIFERSPLAVIRFDREGNIVDFNDRFVDMMGSTRGKLLGFNTARYSSPKMRKTIKKALAGEVASYEDSYTSINGGKTTFLRGFFNPVTPGQSPTEVIAALEDITELKKHEKEQQKIEKLESLGVLAGGIAHDFNNILTGIMGNLSFAQVLIEPDHRAHKALVEAEKATRRAAELAQQLLTFAKGGEPNKEVVSLKRLVRDAVSFMLRGSNVRPVVSIPDSLHSIQADEGQICQVLNNLIINADQAMPGGGTLTITGANEKLQTGNSFNLDAGLYIRLEIHDTGCGISPEGLAKIFDPYFSTKISGTGLGLATAYSIIQRHKGHIGVSSSVGEGTTFNLFLPSIGKSHKEKPLKAGKNTELSRGGSILIMDDEQMIRDTAAQMLIFLGYEVTTCAGGEAAIELYRTALQAGQPYTVVIMDLTIPGGLGGKESAEHILALDPAAYLIVSSGYSSDPVVANFKQYGFSGAIAKPYNLDDFEKALSVVPVRVVE